jgi:hypothetical protein
MKLAYPLALTACFTTYHTVRNTADPTKPADVAITNRVTRLAAVRPPLDLSAILPDPSERARWPLPGSTHPVFEPHFDIAAALAEPGISWIDLCGRGIQNRHLPGSGQDRVEYLRAWCSAAAKNPDDAVYRLAQLRSSVVLGIPDALPFDISNILADTPDVGAAEHLLAKTTLDHDVALLDTLVATYIEVGKVRDAMDINRLANDADHAPVQNRTCARYARAIVSAPPRARSMGLDDLALVNKSHGKLVTQECLELQHELACWISPGTKCDEYFKDRHMDPHLEHVVHAFMGWPDDAADRDRWADIVHEAAGAYPLPGSEALFITAAEVEMRTSECDGLYLADLLTRAQHMRDDSQHDHALDARFDALIKTIERLHRNAPERCRAELAGT